MPPTKKNSNSESKSLSKSASIKFELGEDNLAKIEMVHNDCPEKLGIIIGLTNSGELFDTILNSVIEQFSQDVVEKILKAIRATTNADKPAISPLDYFGMLAANPENEYEQ